jgi:hypothetical protein
MATLVSRTYYVLISLQCQRISLVILRVGQRVEWPDDLQEPEAEEFFIVSVALFTFYSLLLRNISQISARWQLEQLHKLDECTVQNKRPITYEGVICR